MMRFWPYLMLVLVLSCRRDGSPEHPEFRQATAVVQAWNHLLLELERYTAGYRPPVSARMFGYVGAAAYEAALPALPDQVSLATYFTGYSAPERAPSGGAGFSLPASLNAAYAHMSRRFFPTAPPALLGAIARLEKDWQDRVARDAAAAEVVVRSAAFGYSVAEAIWRWSATDSLGHDAFLYNFDRSYVPPDGPGQWQPSAEHPMPALLPRWGGVRPFVVGPADVTVKPPAAFAEAPGSAFYTEAIEVMTVSNPLSKDHRWMAEFWADDLPGLTVTPAGRWIAIAGQLLERDEPPFAIVLETYLKLGLALSDAGVVSWEAKYRYNVERPESYIRRVIRPGWSPLHDAPPFPSYPSGHSAFGAASCAVLEAMFGSPNHFTDETHADRREFNGAPRSFDTFAEMMHENAFSRIALGVHFRMDCTEGLRIGTLVGRRVAELRLKRSAAAREGW